MRSTMGSELVVEWLKKAARLIEEQSVYLTELDAAVGDADHGINMERGFKKVIEKLSAGGNKDVGLILKETGMALISSVGGASGPLYGTFFIRAAQEASGKAELGPAELEAMFSEGLRGLSERGRAAAGDKTIVDALLPAVKSLGDAAEKGKNLSEALEIAVDAAEQGMKETIPMIAKKGRASYMGERSSGHQDPGATSAFFILKALLIAVTEAGDI